MISSTYEERIDFHKNLAPDFEQDLDARVCLKEVVEEPLTDFEKCYYIEVLSSKDGYEKLEILNKEKELFPYIRPDVSLDSLFYSDIKFSSLLLPQ